MKKWKMILMALAAGTSVAAGGQEIVSMRNNSGVVDGIIDEVADDIKDVVGADIWALFENDEFAAELGISSASFDAIKNDLKNYIRSYSTDEKKLAEAQAAVEALLENADGMSVESIEEKLSEIFK